MRCHFRFRRQMLLCNFVAEDYELNDVSVFRSALAPVELRISETIVRKAMLDFTESGHLPTAILGPLMRFLLWVKADGAEIWLVALPDDLEAIAAPVLDREEIRRVAAQEELPHILRLPQTAAQR